MPRPENRLFVVLSISPLFCLRRTIACNQLARNGQAGTLCASGKAPSRHKTHVLSRRSEYLTLEFI